MFGGQECLSSLGSREACGILGENNISPDASWHFRFWCLPESLPGSLGLPWAFCLYLGLSEHRAGSLGASRGLPVVKRNSRDLGRLFSGWSPALSSALTPDLRHTPSENRVLHEADGAERRNRQTHILVGDLSIPLSTKIEPPDRKSAKLWDIHRTLCLTAAGHTSSCTQATTKKGHVLGHKKSSTNLKELKSHRPYHSVTKWNQTRNW